MTGLFGTYKTIPLLCSGKVSKKADLRSSQIYLAVKTIMQKKKKKKGIEKNVAVIALL